ncbi:MAG: type II toxin-antitoxin system prevent-host-death family antitoxin [Sphingobium sp.]
METVNIHQAKTHLSRLIERVAKGGSFIIARAGKPMAKVVPLEAPALTKAKRLGFMAGEVRVPDDFDRMGEADIAALFSDPA